MGSLLVAQSTECWKYWSPCVDFVSEQFQSHDVSQQQLHKQNAHTLEWFYRTSEYKGFLHFPLRGVGSQKIRNVNWRLEGLNFLETFWNLVFRDLLPEKTLETRFTFIFGQNFQKSFQFQKRCRRKSSKSLDFDTHSSTCSCNGIDFREGRSWN